MLPIDDEANEGNLFQKHFEPICKFFFLIIVTTLIMSIGMYTGTQLSGYNEDNLKNPVDKSSCTCACWDGFYRGRYSRGGYKAFYFNYEKNTIAILGLILLGSHLLRLFLAEFIWKRQWLFALLIPAVYANYYGIWNIINYLNDFDMNRMLKSQIFFSVTELAATYLFAQFLKRRNPQQIPSWWLYLLLSISFLHIQLASGELNFDRMQRNILLILPDFINVIWTTILLINYPHFRPDSKTIGIWIGVTIALWLFYHVFCPFRE